MATTSFCNCCADPGKGENAILVFNGVREAMMVAATQKGTSADVAIDGRRHWPS